MKLTMKKLRKKDRKLSKRLRRTQMGMKLLKDVRQFFRKKDMDSTAKQEGRIIKQLRKRCQKINKQLREIDRRMKELKRGGGAEDFVRWLKGEVGVTERSTRHQQYINIVQAGGTTDPGWPWCSLFGYAGLVDCGAFERDELPDAPWYSGSWLLWDNGHRVSYADVKPGDALIMDWGDGGMTDHVEFYIGNGYSVGGNESHQSGGVVRSAPVPVGKVVGVVRPNW